jgi:Arc/MetJ-type ribon-helix-helix transcriptional regulator
MYGTIGGTIHQVKKTTLYLPDDLKEAIGREASRRGESEAEVVRRALRSMLERPLPRGGIITGEPIAEDVDALLAGFGDR